MATYQIEIRASLMPFPLSFTAHCYLLVSKDDITDRYDVFMPLPGYKELSIHYHDDIYKNSLPPHTGMTIYPTTSLDSQWRLPSWSVSSISGLDNSTAADIYHFVDSGHLKEYPHGDKYNMVFGPNSNTFIQWFADQFPEAKLTLPFTAWGKTYKRKHL